MNSKKRKERKQIITLLVCVAVIILLVVVYAMVKNGFDGPADTDTGLGVENMDVGTFTIIDETYSLMTKLSYTYDNNTISLEVAENKWILSENPDFPLDLEKVLLMTQAISDYGGYRRIAYDESKMASYGFDTPLYDITATYVESDDGEPYSRRYYIGDKNELTGYYYFYEDGSNYIYMVTDALFRYFSYSETDLFFEDTIPAPELSDITAMTATLAGQEPVALEVPETAAKENEDGVIEYTPLELIMNTLMFKVDLEYKNHVAFAVRGEKLAEYGLDSPALTLKLDYTKYVSVSTEDGSTGAQISLDDTVTVMFGNTANVTETDKNGVEVENTIVYIMLEGSETVYAVDADYYTEILVALGVAE